MQRASQTIDSARWYFAVKLTCGSKVDSHIDCDRVETREGWRKEMKRSFNSTFHRITYITKHRIYCYTSVSIAEHKAGDVFCIIHLSRLWVIRNERDYIRAILTKSLSGLARYRGGWGNAFRSREYNPRTIANLPKSELRPHAGLCRVGE